MEYKSIANLPFSVASLEDESTSLEVVSLIELELCSKIEQLVKGKLNNVNNSNILFFFITFPP
jgi:hypothetical protein